MQSFSKFLTFSFIAAFVFLTGCTSIKFNTSHYSAPSTTPETKLRIIVSAGQEKNRFTTRAHANKDLLDFAKILEKKLNENIVEVELFDLSSENSEEIKNQIRNSRSAAYRYTLFLSWSHYTSNSKGGRQLTTTFNLMDRTKKKTIWKSNTSYPVNVFQTPKVADQVIDELVSLKFLKIESS